jgi:hypothetical protein
MPIPTPTLENHSSKHFHAIGCASAHGGLPRNSKIPGPGPRLGPGRGFGVSMFRSAGDPVNDVSGGFAAHKTVHVQVEVQVQVQAAWIWRFAQKLIREPVAVVVSFYS